MKEKNLQLIYLLPDWLEYIKEQTIPNELNKYDTILENTTPCRETLSFLKGIPNS